MKTEVLAAIGENGLQRPAAVNAALAANDRVKYALSLLQMAAAHADQPAQPPAAMKRERVACGIDDESLDNLTAAARRQGSCYVIPGVGRLLDRIRADMRVMAAPVIEAGVPGFAERLEAQLAAMPPADAEGLDAGVLAAMGRANPEPGSDSLHRLVMDLHKQLNVMQASLAQETIDGAASYGLLPEDRPRVAAFMAGLNRTAHLKFDHPGLATTATRSGSRLVIQNDIGTTDAHVLVIHVEDLRVTVTYTDVHPERLRFFQDMLSSHPVQWEVTRSGQLTGGSQFEMATGRFDAADEPACNAYLSHLGSRLVFLIDWNRARRQLRSFLPDGARVALLGWAAEQEIGHRAFLALGGAKLVNQAIEAIGGSAIHFGDRLSDVLGVPDTVAFLRFVLRTARHCLLERGSASLLRDRIRAELARHFSNEERRLLKLAEDHAGLIFELACLVRDGALAMGEEAIQKHRMRATRFEREADRIVGDVRQAARKRPDYVAFVPLMHAADDAADELEDAMFLLAQFGPAQLPEPVLEKLQGLTDLLVQTAQEWVKALLDAAHAKDPGGGEDADDFLVAIDRVLALEHEADDAERALTATSVRHATDFRQLHLCSAVGDRLEEAADALKRASLTLRDRLLGEALDV
jgi:uncharacterized protein Yka (UPF0111/DUF47 family)